MNYSVLPSSQFSRFRTTRCARRGGFTLIEIMVALAIFSLLLIVIFVPLTQGVRFTQIGTARADMQQVAQTTMNRITRELRTAAVVFPNERMAGVTTTNGYQNNVANALTERIGYPYYQGAANVCGTAGRNATAVGAENTARLDFISAGRNATGGKAPYITSLYVSRANTTKDYSDFDNPMVLNRATLPIVQNPPNYGIWLAPSRYPGTPDTACTTDGAAINLGTQWLKQSDEGEVDLQALVSNAPDYNSAAALSSHTRVTPLGSALYAPRVNIPPTGTPDPDRYKTETSFICEDTNSNGIIDRVTVTLVLGKFDNAGAQSRAQTIRLTQTVDLPNTESRFNLPAP